MIRKIWTFSVIICFFTIYIGNSTARAAGGYKQAPGQVTSEADCPYQNPPPADLKSSGKLDSAPKTIDKGDYYFSDGKSIPLLRLRDQIAVRGDEKEIDRIVKEKSALKSKKVGKQKKIHKDTYLYFLEEVAEDDPATELIEALKVDPGINFVSPVFYNEQSGLRMTMTNQIVVKLKEGYGESDLLALNPAYIQIKKAVRFTHNQYILLVKEARGRDILKIAQWYSGLDIIEWAEPDFIGEMTFFWEPGDPEYDVQWHLKNIGQGGGNPEADVDANQAWDLTTGDPDMVVAILDLGVQTDHPDLAANIWINPNEIPGNDNDDDGNGYVDDVNGWNFYDHSPVVDPIDQKDNHGTPCAGVAGACNNTEGGVGIAPHIKILPIKIATGDNWATNSDIAAAIYYAALYADILSCSWGRSPSTTVHNAIISATENGRGNKGCPVFCSSGNGADGFKYVSYREDISEGVMVPPGPHTYAWVYRKDGSVDWGDDSVWIDRVHFPGGEVENFADGIPSGWNTATGWNGYPPFTGNGWYSVNDNNHYWVGADVKSVKSRNIDHNQYTYLEVTKTYYDWGDLDFGLWTSTEAGWDDFEFFIDGYLVYSWTGETKSEYANNYSIVNQIGWPAACDETIAVGSSTNYNFRSFYSQYSDELDFVAPSDGGTLGIYTTDRTGANGYASGSYYDNFGGTSSACPLAAGIAALLLDREPDLTWVQVRQRLRDTADKIGPVNYSNGRNDYFGYGKVNAYMALTPDLDPPANVQASDGTYTNKVLITWSAVLGAQGYDVYRADSETGKKTLIASWHQDDEFTDTTMMPDVQYYYWVKAVNERVESEFSAYDIGWHDPIRVYPGQSIQSAINGSQADDLIVVYPGTYTGTINFSGKAITIQSADPDDPNVVADTILDGNGAGRVVTFNNGEGNDSVLEGVTIQNGYASFGGGIYCENASPTITKCTIINNEAIYCGGGIRIYYFCSPNINQCTIKNNDSGWYGGGIECYDFASPDITNCVISGNSAGSYGGAVEFYSFSSAEITNCTITGNSAGSAGGGLWCYHSSPDVTNCILWNDSPQEISVYAGDNPTVTYSDVQGGYTGTGNLNADPLFINAGAGDYRLQQTSPCINNGTANGAPDTDKDGLPRPIDGEYDMGAYECRIEEHVYSGQSIQTAVNTSDDWYVIVVHPGTYYENIDFNGKLITVMSEDPDDPNVVNNTIIDGGNTDSVIEFVNGEGSNTVLTGFTIRNGEADDEGGGIFCSSSSPTISNCTITGNAADWAGGGIGCVYQSSPSIINCTITGNAADVGGGIYLYNTSGTTITNCSVVENTAGTYAGGICCYYHSSSIIRNCDIADNFSESYAGGIGLLSYCSADITNCTITGNSDSIRTGGIECLNSSLTITNSTLEGNSGSSAGAIRGTNDYPVIVTNCILWNNSPVEIYGDATFTVTYSDIDGGYTGEGNINANPLFVNAGAGDYHLQASSPCIDTGTNEGAPATDKDGVSRPQDGDGIGDAICDMGAYEFVN